MSSARSSIFSFTYAHLKRYPKRTASVMVLYPVAVLLQTVLPAIVLAGILQDLSDQNYKVGDWWGSFGSDLLLAAGLAFAGSVVSRRLARLALWSLEVEVFKDIADTQFEHLLALDPEYHVNNLTGRSVAETAKLQAAFRTVMATLTENVLRSVVVFIAMATVMWSVLPWFLAGFVVILVGFIWLAVRLAEGTVQVGESRAQASNAAAGLFADALTNVSSVKLSCAEEVEAQTHRNATRDVATKSKAVMWAALRREAVFSTMANCLSIFGLTAAVAGVVSYGLPIGSAFLVIRYSKQLDMRLYTICQSVTRDLALAAADSAAGLEVLKTSSMIQDTDDSVELDAASGSFHLEDVQYAYPDAPTVPVLNGLTFSIGVGERVGVVGTSGAGKSTLARLLLRLMDPDDGAVSFDGLDVRDATQKSLRQHVSFVPQEPFLFHRSILENIRYGSSNATTADVVRAAKQARAHDFIVETPGGYDTVVGAQGAKLSGGQRQRIAIARALLRSTPVIIFDEATSALDSVSEQEIQQALDAASDGRTMVVIAHRLATLRSMDRIVVLDEGAVAESGSHSELLVLGGIYAKLWEAQSQEN